MIFHSSIGVTDPERVAGVVAELWGGKAFPFFPGRNGSWMVVVGDDRSTMLEVYPHGHLFTQYKTPGERLPLHTDMPKNSTSHLAVGTVLSQEQVLAIGKREGWNTYEKRRPGGGGFNVIELWVENAILFEILPQEAQAEYIQSGTIEAWEAEATRSAARRVSLKRRQATALDETGGDLNDD